MVDFFQNVIKYSKEEITKDNNKYNTIENISVALTILKNML